MGSLWGLSSWGLLLEVIPMGSLLGGGLGGLLGGRHHLGRGLCVPLWLHRGQWGGVGGNGNWGGGTWTHVKALRGPKGGGGLGEGPQPGSPSPFCGSPPPPSHSTQMAFNPPPPGVTSPWGQNAPFVALVAPPGAPPPGPPTAPHGRLWPPPRRLCVTPRPQKAPLSHRDPMGTRRRGRSGAQGGAGGHRGAPWGTEGLYGAQRGTEGLHGAQRGSMGLHGAQRPLCPLGPWG